MEGDLPIGATPPPAPTTPKRARSTAARAPRAPKVPPKVPQEFREDLSAILDETDRARLAAISSGGSGDDVELARVTQMLTRNPRLVSWLLSVERQQALRERAIAEAKRGEGTDTWAYAAGGGDDLPAWLKRPPRDVAAAGTRSIDRQSSKSRERLEKDSPDFLTRASPTGRVAGDGARYNPGDLDRGSWRNAPDGVGGAYNLRLFAEQDEWVRAAINMRRTQVGRAALQCVPVNPLKSYNRTLMRDIQRLLDQPNEARQNRRELIESVVEDILVLDRGCISKNMDAERKPHAIYAEDGATIKVYPGWSGNPKEPRYLYVDPSNNRRVPLRNDQLICIIDNPGTYRTSLSPVEVLRETIEADRQATLSAIHMVKMKPPPLLVQLPGAQRNQLENIRDYYDTEVAGRKEAFFLGGESPMSVEKMIFSARDNQWMEWQEYLCRKIAVVFKMPPSYFGAQAHATEGDATVNKELFEDSGLVPLLMLIEEYLNSELLGDFAPELDMNRRDLASVNLKIVFPQVGELQRQLHAEKAAEIAATGLVQLPSFTLNQILSMRGEQLVPGGNTFYVNTSLGPVPWLSYDGDVASYNPLQAAAGMNDGGDPNAPIAGKKPAAPKRPQPGGPEQPSNDPQTPPKKPQNAPTPRDAAKKPVGGKTGKDVDDLDLDEFALLDAQRQRMNERKLFDWRVPGYSWSPDTQAYLEALSRAEEEDEPQ